MTQEFTAVLIKIPIKNLINNKLQGAKFMSKTILKTASVLAFERKIDPSDALLFSGN